MKFTVNREVLLKPLAQVAGVVERRQTLPVLSNVLLVLEGNTLSMTGTDLELELVARMPVDSAAAEGEVTVPARKLLDICKSLKQDSDIQFEQDGSKIIVKSGRSRFSLATLPAGEFPNLDDVSTETEFVSSPDNLKRLIDSTSFAMAQQDVRYYLNGMLFEVHDGKIRAVSTDGHRLALCDVDAEVSVKETRQVIIPRKGILELARLFEDGEEIHVALGSNHICVRGENLSFTSKLIDGKFPDYERVLPKGGDKIILADREEIRDAFNRVAILSNEKYRGVRLEIKSGSLTIFANNPDQEEAEETVVIDYQGDSLEIGFNVSYLQEALSVLKSDQVQMTLGDSNSSALLQAPEDDSALYVIMPMRL